MNTNLFSNINPSELVHLFDFLPDVQFWIKDTKSAFQWANKSLLANYGLKNMNEVIGKNDYDLSPFYLAEQFFIEDQEVLKGKSIIDRLELIGNNDNIIDWCITNKRPILSSSGEIIGTLGITRKLNNPQNPKIPISGLSEIVNYIHDNIHLPINITHLASVMHCSISTLERTFKKLLQTSPMAYTRKIKMQYACKALLNTNSSISDIGLSLGYADQSHFIRDFKSFLKMTPLKYRQRSKKSKTIIPE